MGNRQRILDSALELFNQEGIEQVSVRDICQKIEISPGNFSYHFPNKSLLLGELYGGLTKEIAGAMAKMPLDKANVTYFLEAHRQIFFIQLKYRFFYLNLFDILANYPDVRTAYQQQYVAEKQMAKSFFELYKAQGVLSPETTFLQYKRIVDVGMILNNFWLVDAELNDFQDARAKLIHYMQLCCGRLEPYLSPTSQSAYHRYFKELEHVEIMEI